VMDDMIDASISRTEQVGIYLLSGSTGSDEFYFRGSLDALEAFAKDLLEQVAELRNA
jgi:MinD-like ATPase involved in chromosome partitioning or flagellar assembly